MKKIFFALVGCLFLVAVFVCYSFRNNVWITDNSGLSVKIRESGDIYQFRAVYNKNKTAAIQHYIDNELHTDFFSNANLDAKVVLNDETSFHMKAAPGLLSIKFDKSDNSHESYLLVKNLAEKIKRKLSEN